MIPKIATALLFIVLLFVNPLKVEDKKICTNLPFLDSQCIGYSNAKEIKLADLGD